MKAQESKGTSRLLVAVAVMAAVAALALALWGCAPQATTSMAATGGDAEATEEAAPSMYPDFTDRTSGNFNDTLSTTDMLNAGNRGCNVCNDAEYYNRQYALNGCVNVSCNPCNGCNPCNN